LAAKNQPVAGHSWLKTHLRQQNSQAEVLKVVDNANESQGTISSLISEKDELNNILADKDEEIINLRRIIDSKEQDLQEAMFQLNSIRMSLPFKILNRYCHGVERLFPKDTYRHKLYKQIVKAGNILIDEGFIKMIRRAIRYLKKGGLRRGFEDNNKRYQLWMERYEPKAGELHAARKEGAAFRYQPLISIVMPVYNVEELWLRAAIESVSKQIYGQWELCIVDDASTKPHIKTVLQEYMNRDGRVRAVFLEENLGISGASNAALDLATGEFVGLLDNDDELAPFALFEVVKLLNQVPDLDFVYSDEDKLEVNGARTEPFFKPDFSPDLLTSMNYICHFSVFRRDLLRQIGGFRKGFEGSQDYDLVLRATEHARNIAHIPKVLYHWRKIPGSASASVNAKDYAFQAGCRALEEALVRRGQNGKVEMIMPGRYRIRYEIEDRPLVSIIIPTKDKVEFLRRCLDSIREKSSYTNYEIIVVDNNSIEAETMHYLDLIRKRPECRVLSFNEPFNYARLNNFAAGQAKGEFLLFLNNDTEVITSGWMEEMISHAQRREIGAVGIKLLFPNNIVQHGGVIVGLGGVAGHAFYGSPAGDHGYIDFAMITRNCAAVTAACLMMRREVFEEVGGFDEEIDVAYNDVDLCLKIISNSYYIVWTPHATLYHYESASRGQFQPERNIRYFCDKWQKFLEGGDPFYNPQLALDRNDFMVKS
jgi:GT2 family glycosyltransferase